MSPLKLVVRLSLGRRCAHDQAIQLFADFNLARKARPRTGAFHGGQHRGLYGSWR